MDYKEQLIERVNWFLQKYPKTEIVGEIRTEADAEWVLEEFNRYTSNEFREMALRNLSIDIEVETRSRKVLLSR